MALSHSTRVFSVVDAAIAKITADSPGSNPTYATSVNIVGVQAVTSTVEMDLKQLRGDNTLLAVDAIFKDVKGKVTYGKFNFDLAAASTTATVTDSGVTPNQKTVVTLAQFDLPANWKLETQTKAVDYVGGDVHFVYWKCQQSSMDMFGTAQEDYNQQGMDFNPFPLLGTPTGFPANAWVTAIANETAVAIV